MSVPSILIVAGYRNLSAYLVLPDGLPEIVTSIDCEHDSPTSVPLVDWNDGSRCHKAMAEQISQVLERYGPDSWGLACPPELARNIPRLLAPEQVATLGVLKKIDVEKVDISNVCTVFDSATNDQTRQKEHC